AERAAEGAAPADPRRAARMGAPAAHGVTLAPAHFRECPEARASPGRLSPSSRDRPALHPGPKGGAEGAPNVPTRGGFWKGGPAPPCIWGLPPLAFSCPAAVKVDGGDVAEGHAEPHP